MNLVENHEQKKLGLKRINYEYNWTNLDPHDSIDAAELLEDLQTAAHEQRAPHVWRGQGAAQHEAWPGGKIK